MDGTYGSSGQPANPDKAQIEREIQSTRDHKHTVNATLDVTSLRKKAAEHANEAAAFFRKYRKEESIAMKLTQKGHKVRRQADEYIQKSKDFDTKASEMEAMTSQQTDPAKVGKMRVKRSKLIEKSAKMKQKAAAKQSKGAKLDHAAVEHTAKSKELLEKSKLNEAEAKAYHDRADQLEKAIGSTQ
ncbi:MAG: hypothetical protein V1934_06920 [Methanobacteriota archaeon]